MTGNYKMLERLTAMIEALLEMVKEQAAIIESAGITVAGSDYAEDIRRMEEFLQS